ncbi:MAG: Crp/Fnr family transcriptional regulator [Planctomycetaceae bacterium]|nr:Crp/Fnr family transcriptional regulator [Planctomycetaceae bacterium]
MTTSTIESMLANTPLGRGLSADDLSKLAAIASVVDAGAGKTLFQEGDKADQLYLVIHGLVGLDMCLPRQGCTRILTIGPGQFVGWSAIVGHGQMTTRASVLEPATLITFPGNQLETLFAQDHDIGFQVMRQVAIGMSQRLTGTRLQMLDLFGETRPVAPPHYGSDKSSESGQ